MRTIIRLQQQRPYKTCTLRANVNPTNGQLGGHPFKLVALGLREIPNGLRGHFCSESLQIYCHKTLATLSLNGWNIQGIIIDAWQNSTSDGMFYLIETKKSWVKKVAEGIAIGSIKEANWSDSWFFKYQIKMNVNVELKVVFWFKWLGNRRGVAN